MMIEFLLYVDDMLILGQNVGRMNRKNQQWSNCYSRLGTSKADPWHENYQRYIIRPRSCGYLRRSTLIKYWRDEKWTRRRRLVVLLLFRLSSKQCPSTDREKDEMDRVPYPSLEVWSMPWCVHGQILLIGLVSQFLSNPGLNFKEEKAEFKEGKPSSGIEWVEFSKNLRLKSSFLS